MDETPGFDIIKTNAEIRRWPTAKLSQRKYIQRDDLLPTVPVNDTVILANCAKNTDQGGMSSFTRTPRAPSTKRTGRNAASGFDVLVISLDGAHLS